MGADLQAMTARHGVDMAKQIHRASVRRMSGQMRLNAAVGLPRPTLDERFGAVQLGQATLQVKAPCAS
jgi:hypothetical protein